MAYAPLHKMASKPLAAAKKSTPTNGSTPGSREEAIKFDSKKHRGTEALWNCAIPDSPTLHPTPGQFYQVQPGDTLPGIAERVYGYSPDFDAIALAQVINDDPCNAKFHTKTISPEDSAIYSGSMISLTPTFAVEADAQSAGVPGRGYPIIRIPPKTFGGFSEYTGFQVPQLFPEGQPDRLEPSPSSRLGGGFVHESCDVYESNGCLRDFSSLAQDAWSAATSMIEEAYMEFPRHGAVPSDLDEPRRQALETHLGLKTEHFAVESNKTIIMEVRAKLAGLNAKFKTRSSQIRCDDDGDMHMRCPAVNASATRHSFSFCRKSLDNAMYRKKWPELMIHEVMHTLSTGGTWDFDIYGWEKSYESLTVEQRSVNPDSYANYVTQGASTPPAFAGELPRCIFLDTSGE